MSALSKEALAHRLMRVLHQNKHEAFLAGGCVRDKLMGKTARDFDIASSATPEEVQKLFSKTVAIGAHFGVVVVIEEGHNFEVATFRKEGGYFDGRHPTKVSFSNVEEDAKRRDFTVNGLYFDIVKNEVLDFVGGKEDLKNKVLKTIGNPDERFLEDHLRLMRAIRFSVQLDFEIEENTIRSVKRNAALIKKISHERVRDELTKILTSKKPALGIRRLDEVGLLKEILPEADMMKGVEQPMEFHPEGDVFVHTMMLLDGLSEAPIELAMGCFLHDIAKPQTFDRAADRIRFHGHDTIGAEMSEEICKRLTFTNEQTKLISRLVLEHLKFKDAFNMKLSTLKRFISIDRFDLHLELHRLDCMASHGKLDAYRFCFDKYEEFKKEPPPPPKFVTGDDLIQRGFKPGPEFSSIIRAIEDAYLEGKIKTREEALSFLDENYTSK